MFLDLNFLFKTNSHCAVDDILLFFLNWWLFCSSHRVGIPNARSTFIITLNDGISWIRHTVLVWFAFRVGLSGRFGPKISKSARLKELNRMGGKIIIISLY